MGEGRKAGNKTINGILFSFRPFCPLPGLLLQPVIARTIPAQSDVDSLPREPGNPVRMAENMVAVSNFRQAFNICKIRVLKKLLFPARIFHLSCLIFNIRKKTDLKGNEIIAGLIQGDNQAFRSLVDQFQVPVLNICLGVVHNRQDAEDLAQEVFAEVFRSVKNFRGDSGLSTWIYRIAVNKSINFTRKQKRWKFLTHPEKILPGSENTHVKMAAAPDPNVKLENQQLLQQLHKALDQLPENQRIAFTLNKIEELSYKEIAEVMVLSVSSVESLIHRAKVLLQKKLWSCYEKKCL